MNFDRIKKLDKQFKDNEKKFLKYKKNYEKKQQKIIEDKKNILFSLFEKSGLGYSEFLDLISENKKEEPKKVEEPQPETEAKQQD